MQAICEHGRGRYAVQGVRWKGCSLRARSTCALQCKECGGGHRYASTVVSALMQGVRWVHQSVSTVVSAMSARNAVGKEYASTVVGAESARSAVDCKFSWEGG